MDASVRLRRRTAQSRELVERLGNFMPSGDTRTVTFYPPYPLALRKGKGCRIWDLDGNEYIDLLNNYSALVHGHAHPTITAALIGQIPRGTVFPAPGELQEQLARRLCSRFSGIEHVRFCNSGTEAVLMAVKGARALTGRSQILKIRGGYHGSWEQLPMSDADRSARALPESQRKLLHTVALNDVAALQAVMAKRGDQIAAIIVEPVLGEGVIAASEEFLQAARSAARTDGALLIFDEVITARLSEGGYQEKVGIEPDVTTLGKYIGGGLPVGGFGGRVDVMAVYDPRREDSIEHSGTFNGNPLTMCAGVAAIDLLDQAAIETMSALAGQLECEIAALFARFEMNAAVTRCGSLIHLHFDTKGPIESFADLRLDSPRLVDFHLAALDEGVYFAPRGLLNLSTAMRPSDIEEAVDRLERAVKRVQPSTAKCAEG